MTTGTEELPQCKCGFTREDFGKEICIEAKGEWGIWGWVSLLTGVTSPPKKVTFSCTRCGMVFDTSTDPDVLAKHS